MDIFLNKSRNYKTGRWTDTFRAFFQNAPVGFAIVDKENVILKANDRFCELFGCIEAEITSNKITDYFDDDPLEIIKDLTEKEVEIKYKPKKTQIECTVDTVIKPVLNKRGKLVQYILMTFDIRKTRIFEIQILELSVIIDQSPSSIIITDTGGIIQYVNPAFVNLTGYTFEEVLGKNISFYRSGEIRDEVYKELWDTILSGNTWKGELISRKKNGELYEEYSVIAPIKEKNDKINYFVAIKEDMTLLKQHQKKLRESERLAAIGKMAGYLLHEIKSPFASIKMNAELLRGQISGSNSSFNIIEREVKRLDKLLNDVLQYSREKDLEIVNVNVFQAINYSIELLEPLLNSKEITFKNNVQNVSIKADGQQLKSLFLYLLENSVEATDTGGKIEAGSETEGDNIIIYYKDSGCGIGSEFAEKIFEPFFTSKAKGSGLGLSLAKRIVEKHGGTIELQCGKKGETTFRIILPLGQ